MPSCLPVLMRMVMGMEVMRVMRVKKYLDS
jgi:hypothetical protein